MMEAGQRDDYVRRVLAAYRTTPGTGGVIRGPDRALAAQFHQRGVPLAVIENALVLAAARRLARDPAAPPLPLVRSLAYFVPVIEEVLAAPANPAYFEHVRRTLQRFLSRP